MFDLITGNIDRPLREPAPGSKVFSIVAHVVLATVIIALPLLSVTDALPAVPTMMAFVSMPPAPPPPPPPPPPPAAQAAPEHQAPKLIEAPPVPTAAPAEIKPEQPVAPVADEEFEGGVEGGVAGGVAGGIVGGLVAPPPPPPPPAPRGPVRVGGEITTPALIHRVEPIYPNVATAAQLGGMVILEAIVDVSGNVESVKVLRGNALLNQAAIDALRQWRYSPLVLNGVPTPFILTVTFRFSVKVA